MKLPTYLSVILMLGLTVVLYHQSNDHRRQLNTQAAMVAPVSLPALRPAAALPEGVHRMLGTRLAFFGPQLNADQLTSFLASYHIDHVVDLAHERKAERILKGEEERRIVERYGAQYWAFNIEGRNDRLNQVYLNRIDSLLDTHEAVFVHCLHGIHRAGVVKGRAYARDLRRWEDVIDLIGWNNVINNPKYDRYTNDVWEQVQRRNHPVAR